MSTLDEPSRIGKRAISCTVCIILLFSIWLGSLTHHRGLVRYGSNCYLRQAAFFVENRGVRSRGLVEPAPFAVWPLGYPFAIAVVSRLTTLPVFWAAKALNSLVVGIVVLLVRALPRTGGAACLALLSAGMVSMFSSTFAEGVFRLALLVVALTVARLVVRPSGSAALGLAITFGSAFSIRYVGAVLVCPIVAAWAWARVGGQPRGTKLLAAALVGGASLIGAYMVLTWWIAGSLLPPRVPRTESVATFLYETTKAFVAEANFAFLYIPNPRDITSLAVVTGVLILTTVAILGVWRQGARLRQGQHSLHREERVTLVVLALVGAFFWATMTVLKFRVYFNPLDFRLLGPRTLLMSAAAFGALATLGVSQHRTAMTAVATVIVTTVIHSCLYTPWQDYQTDGGLFPDRMETIHRRYEDVPAGSVILRGSLHLLFLRPDLLVVPQERIRSRESFDNLRAQAVRAGRQVWVERDGHPLHEPR